MTIKEFALKKNVLESTVRGWCGKNWIRGAKLDEKTGEYDIPSSGRRVESLHDVINLVRFA